MTNVGIPVEALSEIKVGNVVLQYRDQGEGPVLFFLHGALINSNTWQAIIEPLSTEFRCIAPDLPIGGHRVAVDPETDLSPPGIANLLEAFVQELGLEEFCLIGNDTGGAYGQMYAARHPEKISHLVLSNCDALDVFPPTHFSSLQKFINVPGYLPTMGALFRIRPFLKLNMVFGLLSYSLTGNDLYVRFSHNFAHNPKVRENFQRVVNGWSPNYTQTAANALKEFQKPVLILWAEDDEILFPLSLGKRLADVFPNAQFETVANSLTYVQEDQPEKFVERLGHFLGV